MNLLSKNNSLSLALAATAILAVSNVSSPAQSAMATISGGAPDGSGFDYTITLKNNGSDNLNTFWFGWTINGNNLLSDPTSASNSIGWANELDANAIIWANTTSASALTPGASATFSFVTTDTLAELTTAPHGGSVAFTSDNIQISQGVAGQSTSEFSPAIVTAPEPSAFGLLAAGLPLLAVSFRRLTAARKSRQIP